MLILRWFLPISLLLVQSAICSALEQNVSSSFETTSEQLQGQLKKYDYRHPPLPEINDQSGRRKEKSIIVSEKTSKPLRRTQSAGVRQRVRPEVNTYGSQIPVEVIYDPEPTPVFSSPSQANTSPLGRPTKVLLKRRLLQSNNRNKNLDIRQTPKDDAVNITNIQKMTNNISSTTEFPKRPRESYFKKRAERPAPKVKIIEEKNFVYGHRGNFHYSFLGGDGTQVSSEGTLKSYDNNKTGEAVSGSVFYKDNDGNDFSLTYTADENGYRPVGAHLPTPPPIPPAIARALKYIAERSTPSPLDKPE